jgi:dTDP-4-dehydrorhamnose reductase
MLLVTGASGLLGASLVSFARDLGLNVIALCHRHKITITNVPVYSVDLTDRTATRDVIANLRPASIVHCAAATNVDWCEGHPKETQAVNVQATSFVAEIASELRSRVLYISTDSVFDGKRGNYSEAARPAPLNVYARSKLCGELEVLRRHPAALVARVSIYGWNVQNKQSLAEWVLRQLAAGKEIGGFTDVHFSPMLVNDLAEVLLSMLDRRLSGLYHVVGSERISKYEFARRVAMASGFEPERVLPARVVDASLRAARPLDVSLNTGKVSVALGRAMPDVDSGLRRFRALHQSGYPQQLRSYLAGVHVSTS